MNFKLKPLAILISSAFLMIMVLHSCSTEKNAFLNRSYHFITVKYNGLFNGNESYKLALKNIEFADNDEFDEFLDVYKYGNAIDNKNEYSNLDRSLMKGAKMIDRHSMKFKTSSEEVEYNQMIDDCYLLIGKARFLKFDLEAAKETFLFVKNTYKKGDERYKASLWLVLTYIYQGNFVDAETTIKAIKSDKEFPEKLQNQLALIEAISFKKSGQIQKSISAFEKVIINVKKRKLKQRLQYILAQLYQSENDFLKASRLYKIIAKKATHYDLQFNAKINLATTYDGSGDDVITILRKMLKDAKNIEYLDQVHFGLAKVFEKQGKDNLATENYKLSAKKSISNPKQKGKSFLALGDYYFKKSDYLKAYNYYDSSLVSLPKTYSNYKDIYSNKESLKDLVKHLKIIQEQDSLLVIAKMSEQDLNNFIKVKIARAIQEEEEKMALEDSRREKALAEASMQVSNGATWVFENPALLATGFNEFKSVWGDRILEDNWRRQDKSSISFSLAQENETNDVSIESLPEKQTEIYYLKDVPFKTYQQEIAHQKIINSCYQLGIIYRDNFNDLLKSTFYFNKINSSYPQNSKEAITWYQLYRNYDKMNKISEKIEMKNKLINNYPNSEYAKLLINPNMLAEQEKRSVQDDEVYEEIFFTFKKEQYLKVISDVDSYKENVKRSELKAKFDLIKAFAKGNLYGRDTLEYYLRKTRQDNSGTGASEDVVVILEKFENKRQKMLMHKNDSLTKEKNFIIAKNEPHYFVMIFNNKKNKSSELINEISNFNSEFYLLKNLKSKSISWSTDEDAIVVKSFKTNSESGNYYETIKQKFLNYNLELGELNFVIAKSNYAKLFKYKEAIKYIDFFRKNYSPRK